MEFMIPIYRIVHFLGLALLLGGIICSIVLVKKTKPSVAGALAAWNCMHLVAAPGLMLLIITGILHSATLYWENFKGAGYMHAKIVLVAAVLVFVFIDMRIQKAIIRSNPSADTVIDMVKKRQFLGISSCVLIVLIMWLVSYRPF